MRHVKKVKNSDKVLKNKDYKIFITFLSSHLLPYSHAYGQ